jgi:hypothetical protein
VFRVFQLETRKALWNTPHNRHPDNLLISGVLPARKVPRVQDQILSSEQAAGSLDIHLRPINAGVLSHSPAE